MNSWISWFGTAQPAVQAAVVSGFILLAAAAINLLSSVITKSLEIRSKNQEWLRSNQHRSIEDLIESITKLQDHIEFYRRNLFSKARDKFVSDLVLSLTRRWRGLSSEDQFRDEVIKTFVGYVEEVAKITNDFVASMEWLDGAERNSWFWLTRKNQIVAAIAAHKANVRALEPLLFKMFRDVGERGEKLMFDLLESAEGDSISTKDNAIGQYLKDLEAMNQNYKAVNNSELAAFYKLTDGSFQVLMLEIDLEIDAMPGVQRRSLKHWISKISAGAVTHSSVRTGSRYPRV